MQALGFGTTNGNQVLGEGLVVHHHTWKHWKHFYQNVSKTKHPLGLEKPNNQELGDNFTVVIGGTLYFPLGYTSKVFHGCPSWAGEGSDSCRTQPLSLKTQYWCRMMLLSCTT